MFDLNFIRTEVIVGGVTDRHPANPSYETECAIKIYSIHN